MGGWENQQENDRVKSRARGGTAFLRPSAVRTRPLSCFAVSSSLIPVACPFSGSIHARVCSPAKYVECFMDVYNVYIKGCGLATLTQGGVAGLPPRIPGHVLEPRASGRCVLTCRLGPCAASVVLLASLLPSRQRAVCILLVFHWCLSCLCLADM